MYELLERVARRVADWAQRQHAELLPLQSVDRVKKLVRDTERERINALLRRR